MSSSPLDPRWYVRGVNDSHAYDRGVPTLERGTSFCLTCVLVHANPIGRDWHVEGPDVDHMLCGMLIALDEGEVRIRPGKNMCGRCVAVMKEDAA